MAWNTGGRYYRPQTKLWEGYVLTGVCDSVHKEWGVGIPACIAGLQAHTQGGKLRGLTWGGSPGPHPGGKLRGLAWRGVSRPTPGGLQAHTRGGRSPGPHGGIPACTEVDTRPPPPSDGYCRGLYASYWNAILFTGVLPVPADQQEALRGVVLYARRDLWQDGL